MQQSHGIGGADGETDSGGILWLTKLITRSDVKMCIQWSEDHLDKQPQKAKKENPDRL